MCKKRVELHIDSTMIIRRDKNSFDELVKHTLNIGSDRVAVLDNGSVDSYWEWVEYSKKINEWSDFYICGMRAEVEGSPCVFLIKNEAGRINLNRIMTKAYSTPMKDRSRRYNDYRPNIDWNDVNSNREGLLIGADCGNGMASGSLINRLLYGIEIEEEIKKYDYIEIQPIENLLSFFDDGKQAYSREEIQKQTEYLVKGANALHIPVVAVSNAYYKCKEDFIYFDAYNKDEGLVPGWEHPLYIRTAKEMEVAFDFLGESRDMVVYDYPNEIAAQCSKIAPFSDKTYFYVYPNAEEKLEEIAWSGAHGIYGKELPSIVEMQLKKEITAVSASRKNLITYLVLSDAAAFLGEDVYAIECVGNLSSSFLAFCMGITSVNPLQPHYYCKEDEYTEFFDTVNVQCGYELPEKVCPICGKSLCRDGFSLSLEMLLGADLKEERHIRGLRISKDHIGDVRKRMQEKYGIDKLIFGGVLGTLSQEGAWRLARKYVNLSGIEAEIQTDDIADHIVGIKRNDDRCPFLSILLPDGMDINEITSVRRNIVDGVEGWTTNTDYHRFQDKVDSFYLSADDRCAFLHQLKESSGVNIPMEAWSDPKVAELLCKNNPFGLQDRYFEEQNGFIGIRTFDRKELSIIFQTIHGHSFMEFVRAVLASIGDDVWENNAQRLICERGKSIDEVIVCREDLLDVLLKAGVAMDDACQLVERELSRAGLSDESEAVMRAAGIDEWIIDSCRKSGYLYCKAHAIPACKMAWMSAWYKLYYPEAFYKAYYETYREDMPKKDERDLILKIQEYKREDDTYRYSAYRVAAEARARGMEPEA